jgi:hypothetical protein
LKNAVYIIIVLFVFAACKSKTSDTKFQSKSLAKVMGVGYSAKNNLVNNKLSNPSTDVNLADEIATYYVVVVDTGLNYYSLRDKMESTHNTFNKAIDSMGRHYNKTKNLIALPDNDSDEMYAGEYFPRRYPSEYLSLEYLKDYRTSSAEKTIALISGIYEKQYSADSALKRLSTLKPQAFVLKASIYVGCMH